MTGINRILRIVTWLVVPTAVLLVISQLRASPSLPDAIRGSVAGVITLVPEGLVLLTSASLALAVVRLGRRKVLIQQLPAVEMLARTDVVCMDKTGTLTESESSVETVETLSPTLEWRQALGAVAHSDPNPNPSTRAIASGYAAPAGWRLESRVPFSSARKWSAVRFADRGWWVLGAPDVMLAGTRGFGVVVDRADAISAQGRRVMLLARADVDAETQTMRELEPAALVVLHESIKPGAAETLRLLVEQGVAIKLLSGDHPATVAAIAARVGLSTSGDPVDGKQMHEVGPDLLAVVQRASVFGRVSPEQKRDIVRALRAAGHTVAMVGDGVNDVLAMKEADLGIAMGGGSAAARAVAACVLIDGSFAGVPAVLAEGRRVIGNVERLASLFFTKTTYAFLLALAVSLATLPFPFLPRQLTLISAFTIGIPSVYLALAPSFEPSRSGFVRRVMRFALPAGAVAAVATFGAYALAVNEPNVSISEERSVHRLVDPGSTGATSYRFSSRTDSRHGRGPCDRHAAGPGEKGVRPRLSAADRGDFGGRHHRARTSKPRAGRPGYCVCRTPPTRLGCEGEAPRKKLEHRLLVLRVRGVVRLHMPGAGDHEQLLGTGRRREDRETFRWRDDCIGAADNRQQGFVQEGRVCRSPDAPERRPDVGLAERHERSCRGWQRPPRLQSTHQASSQTALPVRDPANALRPPPHGHPRALGSPSWSHSRRTGRDLADRKRAGCSRPREGIPPG